MGRGYQVQKQREEEVAPEEMQAFARYEPDAGALPGGYLLGLIALAALAGATIFGGPRREQPRIRAAAAETRLYETRRRSHRRSGR
jgi:hypothetical protein